MGGVRVEMIPDLDCDTLSDLEEKWLVMTSMHTIFAYARQALRSPWFVFPRLSVAMWQVVLNHHKVRAAKLLLVRSPKVLF